MNRKRAGATEAKGADKGVAETQGLEYDTLKLNENAVKVLERRYLKKDKTGKVTETPMELFRRVAENMAQPEKRYRNDKALRETREEFLRIMTTLEFMPNSPTLMNAGRELQQLSACFVLPIDDSMTSIFETLKHTALIHKSGGGTGFSFSRLRPAEDMVLSTRGIASGPISFMQVYDVATETIKQGGTRRGANMGILRVDHPNIKEFIDAKLDSKRLNNFNISVAITDKFMEALENSEEFNIMNPRSREVMARFSAREIFDMIVKNAWRNGEPGIIFIDRINKYNPTPHVGTIESTNPCVTGETLVYTDEGLHRADALCADAGRTALAVTADPRMSPGRATLPASNIYRTGRRKVFRLTTREGYSIRLTANHMMMTERGWVEAGHLMPGDKLHILARKGRFAGKGDADTGRILGWLVGDGTVKKDRAVLSFFGSEKRELAPMFAEMVDRKVRGMQMKDRDYPVGVVDVKGRDEARVSSKRLLGMVREFGLLEKKHQVPDMVLSSSEGFQRGFLQALFTADGGVQGNAKKGVSIRLAQSDLGLLGRVQQMLLNFGIASRVYRSRRKAHDKMMPDGRGGSRRYHCREQHELVITKENLEAFRREIGFLTERKNARLERHLSSGARGPYAEAFKATFAGLVEEGEEDVYDLTEPMTHSFVANGFVVHNCGEQPLLPYESCNLGSINLSLMVMQSDEGEKAIDYPRLRRIVRSAVRFLDNVIDMNKFPLREIKTMTLGNRKIGLGVMGFADLLYKLGIPYNSNEALEVAEEVMKFINDESKAMSIELADERGTFPNYHGSIFDHKGGPQLRNATTTTIAPTGTISIIAGCSSGIEPAFAIVFKRTVMDKDELIEVNPVFEECARSRGFYSEELMREIAEKGSLKEIAGIPEDVARVFVTAHDISPEWHIKMQAAFQKFTDNAVSKTVNFPHDATVQDVETVYMLAYKLGCKGVTIYRDGSREEQVLSFGSAKVGADGAPVSEYVMPGTIKPRPRPDAMSGTTVRMMTGCGKLYVTINKDDYGIFEVFSQMGKSGGCANSQSEAVSRLVSLALRAGVDPYAVIKHIKGIRCPSPSQTLIKGGPVLSCPDAIAKAIERHLRGEPPRPIEKEETTLDHFEEKDEDGGSKAAIGNVAGVCPDCGNPLAYEEGCLLCRSCGYSKCG